MQKIARGKYVARLAAGPEDVAAAQAFRARIFRGGATPSDCDDLDGRCDHMLVEHQQTGAVVCCFRMMSLASGGEIDRCYSAQYYDLESLRAYPDPMVEMGRFCVDSSHRDPDILRIAWRAMTAYVDQKGARMLFGCSSFQGTEAEAYIDSFALLAARHIAPNRWLPKVKAPTVFPFAKQMASRQPDMKRALSRMPPLLRTYLAMGGWVSDHAVVDSDLDTLHVFTGVEITRIPGARTRLLRAI